ncbi:hypothetical protein PM082_024555 [Marasmius tenuissimus]|nr:hypothetical protein PM082_024555 [Marasmius tenuissimus]
MQVPHVGRNGMLCWQNLNQGAQWCVPDALQEPSPGPPESPLSPQGCTFMSISLAGLKSIDVNVARFSYPASQKTTSSSLSNTTLHGLVLSGLDANHQEIWGIDSSFGDTRDSSAG